MSVHTSLYFVFGDGSCKGKEGWLINANGYNFCTCLLKILWQMLLLHNLLSGIRMHVYICRTLPASHWDPAGKQ